MTGSDGAENLNAGAGLSVTDWVVLALLLDAPRHGFAIAKELVPESDLGQILAVHRPVVYRALDRLVSADLAVADHVEPGAAGPNRTIHRVSTEGSSAVTAWLERPVGHVRDLRIEFLVKLRLNQRLGRSNRALIAAQKAELDPTLDGLVRSDEDHVADRWRRGNAAAAQAFLDEVARDLR